MAAMSSPHTHPNPSLVLKLVDWQGRDLFFKCRMSSPLGKMRETFCDRFDLDKDRILLVFDGKEIKDWDTPMGIGLEDGDTLDVVDTQIKEARQAAQTHHRAREGGSLAFLH